jgi:probable F420-dependent oxidoreductase
VGVPTDSRTRPFRFGILASDDTGASPSDWTDQARRAEDEGFSTLLVGDHFVTPFACTPRLAAASAVTTVLRLGSYVYCNDFRSPVLLAKEAAELDRLSGGRLELGLGAGWLKEEYDMVGLSFDPPKTRVDRFQEAVGIIRRLLAGETVTLRGEHYALDGYELPSMPVQQPIPLLLGGGGPRMTRYAARHADIIGFDPMARPGGGKEDREFGHAAFEEKLDVLDEMCAHRSDAGPERSIVIFHVARRVEDLPADAWMDPQLAPESPYALVGDTSAIVDTLTDRRERWGLSYYVFFDDDVPLVRDALTRLSGQ